MALLEFLKALERLLDYLIRVEVAILRESSAKIH